jgi:hypothetical protein
MGISEPKSAVEPSMVQSYPVAYKVVTWVRIVTVTVALAFGFAWTYLMFHPGYAHGELVFNPTLIGFDALVIAAAFYSIAWALTAQITLYADRFEQRKPFINRVLRITDIAGRRYRSGYFVIVPKSGTPVPIDKTSYGLDRTFEQWFLRLPDLQKIAAEKNLERIRNDASLGATPGERIAADGARKQRFGLIGGCLAVASFVLFYACMLTHDHLAVLAGISAFLPWAALLLIRIYKDQVAGPDSGKAGFIVLPFFMPVGALGMLAVQNAALLDPKGVIAYGFVVGAVLLFVLFRALHQPDSSARQKLVLVLVFLPFIWLYSGSLLALGNRLLDGGPYQVIPTTVLGKHMQRGKSGRTYYLEISGWNGMPEGARIRVEGYQYIEVNKGDALCMALYPGRFGFRWMKGINCAGQNDPF